MPRRACRGKVVTNALFTYSAIAIGGAIGACLRFALSEWMLHLFGRAFPFGTLLVNILGSFVIGLLYGLLIIRTNCPQSMADFYWHWCAWCFYHFFQTFSMDTVLLLQQGDWQKAVANVVLNLVFVFNPRLAWIKARLDEVIIYVR